MYFASRVGKTEDYSGKDRNEVLLVVDMRERKVAVHIAGKGRVSDLIEEKMKLVLLFEPEEEHETYARQAISDSCKSRRRGKVQWQIYGVKESQSGTF